jgi:hypothetical protein
VLVAQLPHLQAGFFLLRLLPAWVPARPLVQLLFCSFATASRHNVVTFFRSKVPLAAATRGRSDRCGHGGKDDSESPVGAETGLALTSYIKEEAPA